MLLLLLLACPPQDDPDPGELCRAEELGCCSDDECGAGEICHFSYSCWIQDGARRCSEPAGTNRCHQLCEGDSGFSCEELTQECQVVDHVQGGDSIEQVEACF